jgi:general secretion pathway protein G
MAGFTLLELMMAVTVVGVLSGLGVVSYRNHIEQAKIVVAISDIRMVTIGISQFVLDNRRLPADIAEAGYAGFRDPWGNSYVYLPFTGPASLGKARKDRRLVPINSDYDLYSVGKDGQSRAPLAVPVSQDDIIRAGNGAFIGTAADF